MKFQRPSNRSVEYDTQAYQRTRTRSIEMPIYRSTFSLIACRDPEIDLKIAFSSDCEINNQHCALGCGRSLTWNCDSYIAARELLRMSPMEQVGDFQRGMGQKDIFNLMHAIFHYNAHLWYESKIARIPFMNEPEKVFALQESHYELRKASMILLMFGNVELYSMYTFEPKYPQLARLCQNMYAQKYVVDIIKGLGTVVRRLSELQKTPTSSESQEEIDREVCEGMTTPIFYCPPESLKEFEFDINSPFLVAQEVSQAESGLTTSIV